MGFIDNCINALEKELGLKNVEYDILPDNEFASNVQACHLTKEEANKIGYDNEIIILRESFAKSNNKGAIFITLAHEIRHWWQHQNNYDFSRYKRGKDYEKQMVEIDAIAFSELMIRKYTGKEVILELDAQARELVEGRKKEIGG